MIDRNYSDDADTNDGRVIVWGLQDLKESLDALVEQQRIANLIALGRVATEQFGNWAGEGGIYGTLFDHPLTETSNFRVKPNIATALGIEVPGKSEQAGDDNDN